MGETPGDGFWLLSTEGVLDESGAPVAGVPFQGTSADAGDRREGRTAVLVDEHEVWEQTGAGWTRRVSTADRMHSVAWGPTGDLLVGTEPAGVARVEEGALRYLEAFGNVPEAELWSTPWGGPAAVRSLAMGGDGTLYANVHVGWIVRSTDGGETWATTRNGLEKDVHQVAAHPREAATVFAATADGFHISHDRGNAYERRIRGLPHLYQRAVACFPDRDVYLSSVATGSGGREAALCRSEDEGRTWSRVEGLPGDLHHNIDTHQVAVRPGGEARAVVDGARLYASRDYGETWSPTAEDLPRIWGLLAL